MTKTGRNGNEGQQLYVKELLKERGLKNKDVAELMGTSEASVSRKLSGQRSIELDWLGALAKVLNVPISQLFTPPWQKAEKITRREEIREFLERVEGLKPHDVEAFTNMIMSVVIANAALRAHSGADDRSEFDIPRREELPSR